MLLSPQISSRINQHTSIKQESNKLVLQMEFAYCKFYNTNNVRVAESD